LASFFNVRAIILLRFAAYMTGEVPQNVDAVLFFMRFHMDKS